MNQNSGVKGLVGSGLTTIPSIFIHPPETLSDLKPKPKSVVIPAINLSGPPFDCGEASSGRVSNLWDFPDRKPWSFGASSRPYDGFHEQLADVKAEFYSREMESGVRFISNFDMFHSKAASWRLVTFEDKAGTKK
ncbi:hypothetical protein V6N12_017136 [Hibiscus sabdariffa]|uniref:Uncharacterized protein n=1 Tax=Hibiscus sabdariffa TaxID=183260 RepID=A0ABR2BBV3_9ROSI